MMERLLALHERYSLARSQSGFAPIVFCGAELVGIPQNQVVDLIIPKLDRLLDSYPLMRCRVTDWWTRKPRWTLADTKWSARDLVADPDHNLTIEEAIDVEHKYGQELIDFRNGPLLRVSVRQIRTSDGSSATLLGVTVHHCLGDGRSTLGILHALLADVATFPIPGDISQLPPSAEDSIPEYTLTPTQIARLIFREVIGPNLPQFLRRFALDDTAWPHGSHILRPPASCPVRRVGLSLSSSTTSSLKRLGRAAGGGTIHAVLQACVGIALIVATSTYPSADVPTSLSISWPISLRKDELGHPQLTGNYVGGSTWHFERTAECSRTLAALIAHMHTLSHDPALLREAATELGTLKFLPELDSPDRPLSDFTVVDNGVVEPAPTGWEHRLRKQAASGTPYRASCEISNLGPLPRSPPVSASLAKGLRRVWFAQTASPVSGVFGVDLVGCPAGDGGVDLSALVSWREGVVPPEVGDAFARAVKVAVDVMCATVDGGKALDGNLTVGDVCDKVALEVFGKSEK
ncbi:hypothetical protein M427DRAFT_143795 [Gonapodya prolifera JEL478]|uniref:CoA-dependent acyltransferase n=1 Tax=Gonapodya prolifera (strain JEL478) TaxID=1344416 RepID=A0A139ANL2_GONPJ|nr:hypothetical protein M427DRAFT_143795 [Gonapodya prolifera JEL478]|eukprot:KXS18322.1 hypothetical protein M427DRAFT_143795 [Gonapodya prolifera JEL478]